MSHINPYTLVEGIVKVASLPDIYSKLDVALASPGCSNRYLADIISEDMALTARLLRLANSSFFNFPSQVDTVSMAITVIGTHQLREVVLASSVVDSFKGMPSDLINMDSFWRHSVACGVACRIIATLRREANVETHFVAGLLHDIGRMVLCKELPDRMKELLEQSGTTTTLLYKTEEDNLGFNHATLSGLLLKSWKLPSPLVEAVSHHHAPEQAKHHFIEAATVHIGDIVANTLQIGSSGETLIPDISNEGWEKLGMKESDTELLVNELDKQYKAAIDFVLNT